MKLMAGHPLGSWYVEYRGSRDGDWGVRRRPFGSRAFAEGIARQEKVRGHDVRVVGPDSAVYDVL